MKIFYTTLEAAAELGCSVKTWHRHARYFDIAPIKHQTRYGATRFMWTSKQVQWLMARYRRWKHRSPSRP